MASFIIILTSVILCLFISGIGALPILLFGLPLSRYFSGVCILIALQLFIGKLWNYFINNIIELQMKEVRVNNAIVDAIQHVTVHCSYCNVSNIIEVCIGKENTFVCNECNQRNTVIVSLSTARITTPIKIHDTSSSIFNMIDKKSIDKKSTDKKPIKQ